MTIAFSKHAKVAHVDFTCTRYLKCKRGTCDKSKCSFCHRDILLYNIYAIVLNEVFALFGDMVYFALRESIKTRRAEILRTRLEAEEEARELEKKSARLVGSYKRAQDAVVALMFKKSRARKFGPAVVLAVLCEISSALEKQNQISVELDGVNTARNAIQSRLQGAKSMEERCKDLSAKLAEMPRPVDKHTLFTGQTARENVKNCWCLLTYMYYTFLSFNTKGPESSHFFEQYELGRKLCSEHFGIVDTLSAHQFMSHVSLTMMRALVIDSTGYVAFNKWLVKKAIERAFGAVRSPTKNGTVKVLSEKDEHLLLDIDAALMQRASHFMPDYVWRFDEPPFSAHDNVLARLLAFGKMALTKCAKFFGGIRHMAYYAYFVFLCSAPDGNRFAYSQKLCALFNMTGKTLFSKNKTDNEVDSPFECHMTSDARPPAINVFLTTKFIEMCCIKAHTHFFEILKWTYISNIQEVCEAFFLSEMHVDVLTTCEHIVRISDAAVEFKKRVYGVDEYNRLNNKLREFFS